MNIVVTGASQGIGKALVQTWTQSTVVPHHIIAISRHTAALQDIATALAAAHSPHKLSILPFDLSCDNYDLLYQFVVEQVPHIDALVHNAGSLVNRPFYELTDGEVHSLFQINTFAAWKLTKYLYTHMPAGSHILNIGSMGGYQGSAKFAGLSAYSASKAALACWSECLAEELKPRRIAVNCLCLGAVQTEMLRQAFPDFDAPLSAAEMAHFIGDFALNGQRYFNGKVLPVSVNTP